MCDNRGVRMSHSDARDSSRSRRTSGRSDDSRSRDHSQSQGPSRDSSSSRDDASQLFKLKSDIKQLREILSKIRDSKIRGPSMQVIRDMEDRYFYTLKLVQEDKTKIETLKSEHGQYREKISNWVDELRMKIETIKSNYDRKIALEMKANEERIQKLEESYSARILEISDQATVMYDDMKMKAEEDLKEQKQAYEKKLEEKLGEFEKVNVEMKKALTEEHDAEIKAIEEKFDEVVTKQRNKLLELQKEIEVKIDETRRKYEFQNSTNQERINYLLSQVKKEKSKVEELSAENSSKVKEIRELEEKLKTSDEEARTAQEELSTVLSDLINGTGSKVPKRLRDEYWSFREKAETAGKDVDRLKDEKMKLLNKFSDLELRIAAFKEVVAEKDIKIKNLQGEIDLNQSNVISEKDARLKELDEKIRWYESAKTEEPVQGLEAMDTSEGSSHNAGQDTDQDGRCCDERVTVKELRAELAKRNKVIADLHRVNPDVLESKLKIKELMERCCQAEKLLKAKNLQYVALLKENQSLESEVLNLKKSSQSWMRDSSSMVKLDSAILPTTSSTSKPPISSAITTGGRAVGAVSVTSGSRPIASPAVMPAHHPYPFGWPATPTPPYAMPQAMPACHPMAYGWPPPPTPAFAMPWTPTAAHVFASASSTTAAVLAPVTTAASIRPKSSSTAIASTATRHPIQSGSTCVPSATVALSATSTTGQTDQNNNTAGQKIASIVSRKW